MDFNYLEAVKNIIAIFSIMNPIAAGAILVSMIGEKSTMAEIELIARKNSFAVFIGMLIILVLGNLILRAFDISVDSIKVIGGIILFMMALGMIQGKHKTVNHSNEDQAESMEREDISIVPLGFPIILGPGLIATILTLRKQTSSYYDSIYLVFEMFICVIASYLILRYIRYIQKVLSNNGMRVFTRIMGLIVGAISVQMVIYGIQGLINK